MSAKPHGKGLRLFWGVENATCMFMRWGSMNAVFFLLLLASSALGKGPADVTCESVLENPYIALRVVETRLKSLGRAELKAIYDQLPADYRGAEAKMVTIADEIARTGDLAHGLLMATLQIQKVRLLFDPREVNSEVRHMIILLDILIGGVVMSSPLYVGMIYQNNPIVLIFFGFVMAMLPLMVFQEDLRDFMMVFFDSDLDKKKLEERTQRIRVILGLKITDESTRIVKSIREVVHEAHIDRITRRLMRAFLHRLKSVSSYTIPETRYEQLVLAQVLLSLVEHLLEVSAFKY